jgi:peptidyl-prolyl cis-trans isomerase D
LEAAIKEANPKASVVKLGMVEKADLIPEIAEAAFTLKSGQHSAPIKSPLGWHILVVNKIEEGRVKPFEEVRDQLRKDIIGYQAADEAHTLAIRLEDALAAGATLEEAATQIDLKVIKLPLIDGNGLTAEGKPAPNLINDVRFMRAAFDTPQGQESQLLELPQNRFAMIYVDQIIPPAAKPFEQVKTDVIAHWQEQQRMDAARKRAEAIAERINKGEAPAAVAQAEKLEIKTTPAFTRASHDSDTGLPETLKAQLFDLKVGSAAAAEGDDGYVVAALKEIKPAPPLPEDARAQLSSQLENAIGGDLLDQLANAFRARYNVEIRRDIIDSRF